MDRNEIRTAALAMKDVKDLRLLLNKVKREALGDKAYPIHLKQITYYCNPKREGVKRYTDFTIPKKSGGVRTISAPVAGLKSILYSLNTILQSVYEPSKYAMGFVPGRSVVDNAKIHIGQNYIYNIDLQDFFPSIDKSRVWKRLTLPPFKFSSDLADVIAGLCTMRMEEGDSIRYVLPQGAPTSPTLTNIICEKLDRQLAGLAKRFGLLYSRYADDITFSSMHYVYAEDGEFIAELNRIIADNHFIINAKKVRLQKSGMRQEVTGLVVTDKVNVLRQYVRELKTIIHIWERYGYMAATQSLLNHRKHNRTYTRTEAAFSLESVVVGKLNYLKMVKGENDAVYMKLYMKYATLKGEVHSRKNKYGHSRSIVYKHTMEIAEFEKKMETKLSYADGMLSFNLCDEKHNVVVSSNIDKEILIQHLSSGKRGPITKYQISLCSNGVGLFYMLHKRYCESIGSREKQLQQELNDIVNSDTFNEVLGGVMADIDLSEIIELEDLDGLDVDIRNCPTIKSFN
mgnify:FL=1